MRRRLKQGGLAAVLLALLGGAIVSAQDPPITVGGVFDTFRPYVVMGAWTYRNAAPITIQPWGNLYGTTITTLASATARTWTLPDATDTSVGKATTDTLTNKTLTAPVLSGSITGTYTLAGTPTLTGPAISSPVLSGTATGTYTLGGTPTIGAPPTVTEGTTAVSAPFGVTQTWNAGGVSFMGLQMAFTETASAAGSHYLDILGGAAGSTAEFAVIKGGATSQLGAETISATTNQMILGTTNTTTLNAPAPAASLTLTIPNAGSSNAAAIPAHFDCASTGTGSQTCSPAAAAATSKVYSGRSTLASNAATITFAPAFTSSTSFECVANDITTRANPVQMIPASGSTATITNTTGASDVIQWLCAGQ